MPFHLATLLTEWNIRESRKLDKATGAKFQSFIGDRAEVQLKCLLEVLDSVGLSSQVLSAIGSVDRLRYLPVEWQPYAYVNSHIPTGVGTCMSSPGLVAIMLDRIRNVSADLIIELGVGSGYHLACASALFNRPCIGVDLPDAIWSTKGPATSNLRIIGDARSVPIRSGCADVVFATFRALKRSTSMLRLLRNGGVLQCIEPLFRNEFEQEPPASWLKTKFGSYDQYIGQRQNNYSCLREYQKWGQTITPLSTLYDVSFLGERRPSDSPESIRNPEWA
jgi:protein-L-isoaspartate O-methyltransferase